LGLRGTMQQGTGEDCIMRSFVIRIPAKYFSDDRNKKHEMSGVCVP